MAQFGVKFDFHSRKHPDKKYNEADILCLKRLSCRHACKRKKDHNEPCGTGKCPFQRIIRRRCGHEIYRPCVGADESTMPDCMWPCAVPKNGSPCDELCCDCGFLACTTEEEKKDNQSSQVPVPELLEQNEDVLETEIDESIQENLITLPEERSETIGKQTKGNLKVVMNIPKKEEGINENQKSVQDLFVFVKPQIPPREVKLEKNKMSRTKLERNGALLENTKINQEIPVSEGVKIPLRAFKEGVEMMPPKMSLLDSECQNYARSGSATPAITKIKKVKQAHDIPEPKGKIYIAGNDLPTPSLPKAEFQCPEAPSRSPEPKGKICIVGKDIPSPSLPKAEFQCPEVPPPPRSPSMPYLKPQNYYFEIPVENQRDRPPKLTRECSPPMEANSTEIKTTPIKKAKLSGDEPNSTKEPEDSAARAPSSGTPLPNFEDCFQTVRSLLNSGMLPTHMTAAEVSRKQLENMKLRSFANFIYARVAREEKLDDEQRLTLRKG